MTAPAQQAERAAKHAEGSAPVAWLARLGLASRGVVWLVIGLLALSVLLGNREQTDQQGALREIASRPLGELLLVLLAVGFLGYAAWQLLVAAVGHREERDDARRWAARAASLFTGAVYAGLAVLTLRFLADSSGSGADRTPSLTADVMSRTGGRTVIGVLGVLVVVVGLVMAARGVTGKHLEALDRGRGPRVLQRLAGPLGTAGLVGRGLVLALLGGFLVRAAVQFDPQQAKGLDAALATLAQQPYGKAMLAVAVAGMLAYAAWSFVETRLRRL
ncbi:MAG: hypothetical protein JWN57_817, partial [Frankiales bacterium]|jgi:hypothetical protein|nr:hypothetical protein [Frankiales bacterium]